MIPTTLKQQWSQGLADGRIVPYLGPGVLADVTSKLDGRPIPATGEQLILGLNNGQPMAPKLMYEFPRAAMNVELKRGRAAVTKFLDATYNATQWTRSAVHEWIRDLAPPYVVDINRDTQLQDSYADKPHTLVLGCARIAGAAMRYKLFAWDGEVYTPIEADQAALNLPILFKPMGSPRPQPTYVASDADYVDYITELMGGFAIPAYLKRYRQGKRYLLLGMRLNRDSERMVLSDLIYGAEAPAGWALIENPTEKEKRFCAKLGLELIEADAAELLPAAEAA
ncbi:MAG: SIR2 family protein [Rhodocyclaceae bacterium]|jgi:hypothetical protein|nr:SIR2 family protein [Rhodocyclaceae bacterium]